MTKPTMLVAVVMTLAAAGSVTGQPASSPRSVSLVITGGTIVTMDGDRRILTPGGLAVDGTDIVAVAESDAIAERFVAADTIDATGMVVLPGLINTHTHAPMVMYRGLADDLALREWLEQYILPAESKTVTPEFVRLGTRLAALEMIRSGTTTYVDMYYFEEAIAEATSDAGLRGVLGQTIIQFPVPDAPTPADALARAERFIEAWREDDLIVPAVAPHSMSTLDEAMLEASRDLARRHGVPMLIHLAETEDEVEIAEERHHQSPTAYLEAIDFGGPNTLAAHGVWVSADDIAILRRRGVGVSHNPESNMKLASGAAPLTRYLEAGVAMSLGTDGAASNNDLDMFEAMRFAALLHKLLDADPRAIGAETALEMATIGGARAIGLERLIGSLEPGKRADLIIVSMNAARQTPMYDLISHVVYTTRGDDVDTTIVNGRILMRAGRVLSLDESAVLAEARAMAEWVQAAVGGAGR